MPFRRRSRTRQLRRAARRLGRDLYTHMAGGRRIPVRVWPLSPLAPLGSDMSRAPESFVVNIEDCTSFVGFSYRSGGWNPHVETVRELLADPSLDYEDSTLYRLYDRFVPTTLQDLFVEDVKRRLEPLASMPPVREHFRYVWILSRARIRKYSGVTAEPRGHQYFGPHDLSTGRAEFERTREVLQSIRREGFAPERYGMIKGYFLADGSSYRFVAGSGNHRLAVLKALGYEEIPCALNDNHPAIIPRERLGTWCIDQGGPFQTATATALFDKLFHETGTSKAQTLGLLEAR